MTCAASGTGQSFSFGFAGGFRRSELVALNVEDLRESPHGFEVMVWSSKGDQYGKGEKVGIPSLAHADTCPVGPELLSVAPGAKYGRPPSGRGRRRHRSVVRRSIAA